MPSPQLAAIPAPPPEIALDAILRSLRDDPTLTLAGVTVWGPEGDRTKLAEVGEPNLGDMPLIRLGLGDFPSKWQHEGQHRGRLNLKVSLYAPGTHYADRLRLWSAFYHAIYPADDPARLAIVTGRLAPATGLVNFELTQSGSATVSLGDDQYAQRTDATLALAFDF